MEGYGMKLMQKALFMMLFLGLLGVSTAAFAADFTDLTPSDCAQCHGSNVANKHHESTAAQQGLCNQCHVGVTTGGDCSQCHNFVPQQNQHHESAPALAGNCVECHSGVGELSECLTCHLGKIRNPHHTAQKDDPRTPVVGDEIACASCHSSMAPIDGCLDCHTGNIRNQHHMTIDSQGFACANCHADTPQPDADCALCHDATFWGADETARNRHHANAASQNIDCTTCHTNAPKPSDCHDCHNGEAKERHHEIAANVSIDCAVCHEAIADNIDEMTN